MVIFTRFQRAVPKSSATKNREILFFAVCFDNPSLKKKKKTSLGRYLLGLTSTFR